jgi:hypothetical protein
VRPVQSSNADAAAPQDDGLRAQGRSTPDVGAPAGASSQGFRILLQQLNPRLEAAINSLQEQQDTKE